MPSLGSKGRQVVMNNKDLGRLARAVEVGLAGEQKVRVTGPLTWSSPTALAMKLIELRTGDVWDVTFTADLADLEALSPAAISEASIHDFALIVSANLVEWWFTRGRTDQNRCVTGSVTPSDV